MITTCECIISMSNSHSLIPLNLEFVLRQDSFVYESKGVLMCKKVKVS